MEPIKPVELNADTDKMATDWAKYTVNHLYEALNKYQVDIGGPLFKSIKTELERNGGHIEKVITKFNQYGRFLDMRVGRGVTIEEGNQNRRRKKPWYAKSYYSDVTRFRVLYMQIYGQEISTQISEALQITAGATL